MCALGHNGSRSKFVAGRPALIRRQVRELGINLSGVQEARTAAGPAHVLLMAMLCLPLGPTGAPWGVSYGLVLRIRMPVLTGRTIASGSLILLPSTRPRESWRLGLLPGACSVLLLLLMLHTLALMLPPVTCGGMICLVDSQGSRML